MTLLASETPICNGEPSVGWVQRRAFDLFKPVPKLSPTEWSDRYRILSKESSAQPGRYDSGIAPYQREPMDSVLDNTVERVVLMWASQTGKTETINNIVGFHIDWKPSPILVLQPTLEMAETWSKDRLVPMLRDTPRMKGKVQDPRSRDANNTILHKRFPGGHVTSCGANSAASLASRPIRVVICDEVDRYPVSAGTEGDPVALAYKRADTFADSVLFMTSTPTVKGLSRIEREYELTDKRQFFCPCPRCKKFQTLKWAQVQWPKDEPQNAYYECEKCLKKLNDRDRIKMIQAGQWRATAPFTGKRGYNINGIYSPFAAKKGFKNRLHYMAVDFLDAKAKGPESLKVWTNTFLAETWEEEAQEGPKAELIYARREEYEKIPAAGCVLVGFGDVHPDRIEIEIMAAGVGEETWGLDYRVFYGNVETWSIWNEVDEYIQRKWPHESGAELQPAAIGFDTGHKSKIVQAFVKRCRPRRVFATKGRGSWNTPWISRSKTQALVLIYVNVGKEAVYSRANIEEPGPGYQHWNKRYDLEYFRRLFSERVVTRYKFGNAYKTFEERGRNEPLDCRVGCLAMLEILKPNYEKLAENLKPLARPANPDAQSDNKPKPIPRPPRRVLGAGLVRNWKR
jgi:phage terminase large subunit GpA-like protein